MDARAEAARVAESSHDVRPHVLHVLGVFPAKLFRPNDVAIESAFVLPRQPGATKCLRADRQEGTEVRRAHPFRGVAKLGSQQFAFALDYVPAKSDANQEKLDLKKATPGAKKAESSSPSDKLKGTIAKAMTPSAIMLKPSSYNRLYFDFNHNGDLTDDKVIEAIDSGMRIPGGASYTQFQFPRVDVTIDVAGTKGRLLLLPQRIRIQRISVQLYERHAQHGRMPRRPHHAGGKETSRRLARLQQQWAFRRRNQGLQNDSPRLRRSYPEPGDMLLLDPETGRSRARPMT